MATGRIAPKIGNPIKVAAANTVYSNNTLTPGIATFNTLTSIIDGAIGSTQGDILYRNSSVWTVLAPGTSGQLLQTQGASANPQWASITSGVGSVSNSDGTLTISPTTGSVVASLAALTSANILVGNGSNIATGVALSGDATLANTGALTIANNAITTVKINNNAVTLAKLATQANNTALGNVSGGTAVPVALTPTQLTTLVNAFTSSLSGAAPSSGGGTTNFLRADATWAVPPGAVASVSNADGTLTISPTTGAVVASIATSAALPGSPTTTTQSAGDNSTKISTTAFVTTAVNNAISGVNPAVAVQAATAAVLPNSPTYNNGVSGIGATLTAGANAALTVDGYTVLLNDRVLVKNQASAFQNGVYTQTTLGTGLVPWVLTRALDYDQPSDINNTGAIPVVNGTVNSSTSWVLTSQVTTVGTSALTFTQFTLNPTTILTTTLTSGDILVGNGSNIATAVAMSGDATLSNAGAITVTKTSGTAFGTAATDNTGTSGATIPLLNGTNTWSGPQTFNNGIVIGTQEIVATTEYDNGNSGSTITINFNNGNQQKLTLTANCTISFTAPSTGVTSIRLFVKQGTGGPWTITWPSMKWAAGIKPPTSVGAAIDIAAIEYSSIDSAYYGVASLNFS